MCGHVRVHVRACARLGTMYVYGPCAGVPYVLRCMHEIDNNNTTPSIILNNDTTTSIILIDDYAERVLLIDDVDECVIYTRQPAA